MSKTKTSNSRFDRGTKAQQSLSYSRCGPLGQRNDAADVELHSLATEEGIDLEGKPRDEWAAVKLPIWALC